MNLDSLITCLGWATLTYSWLHINFTFAAAIAEVIDCHNDAHTSSNGYVDGYNDCANNKANRILNPKYTSPCLTTSS